MAIKMGGVREELAVTRAAVSLWSALLGEALGRLKGRWREGVGGELFNRSSSYRAGCGGREAGRDSKG